MNVRRLLAGVVMLVLAFVARGVAETQDERWDGEWRFARGEQAGAQAEGFDDGAWEQVQLPHDWSVAGPLAANNPTGSPGGFFPAGVGWYRKTFTLPAIPEGGGTPSVAVRFDGVYMLSEVWVNGVTLGVHPYGYTPFRYAMTKLVKFGQKNTIAVRVDNSKQMNSRWYSGSGIYRHVWLEWGGAGLVLRPEDVAIQTASVQGNEAVLKIGLVARNENSAAPSPVFCRARIYALDGDEGKREAVADVNSREAAFVHDEAPLEMEVHVPSPRLWSPEHPQRYRALLELVRGSQEVDRVEISFGIRTIGVSAEKGLLLNGQKEILYGGCVHHDNGALGAAAFDRAEERRVELLKAAGFNAVRTSHNPPSPAFLEACDRLGLLVIDEAFDCWLQGKNREDYHQYFAAQWQNDIDAMVRRDRNHPSVVMWSIGNEIPDFGSVQGLRTGTMLVERVKQLDPTRPVTAAVNWWPRIGGRNEWSWNDADGLMGKLDIVGYNYQIPRYVADHERVPARVIASTESYPRDMFACWQASEEHPWVVGDFVWTAMDYLGESGIGRVWLPGEKTLFHAVPGQYPYHGAYCGDIDITGFRKPVSYARNITWGRGEKMYTSVIEQGTDGKALRVTDWGVVPSRASWTWPGMEGKTVQVEVYSRYEAVRVSVNGKVVGEKPTGEGEQFKASFDVPYAAGTLTTEGLVGGKVVATSALKTAGAVAGLRLTADRTVLKADGEDLAFVTVEAVDGAGNLQPNGDAVVRFEVEGAGTIAGVNSGDLSGTESYAGNERRLFQGRAQVIVRTASRAGEIRVKARAEGLAGAEAALRGL